MGEGHTLQWEDYALGHRDGACSRCTCNAGWSSRESIEVEDEVEEVGRNEIGESDVPL